MPDPKVQRAAAVAIAAATTRLQIDALEPSRVLVAVEALDGIKGEFHLATQGFDGDEEVIAALLALVGGLSRKIGLELDITPSEMPDL